MDLTETAAIITLITAMSAAAVTWLEMRLKLISYRLDKTEENVINLKLKIAETEKIFTEWKWSNK